VVLTAKIKVLLSIFLTNVYQQDKWSSKMQTFKKIILVGLIAAFCGQCFANESLMGSDKKFNQRQQHAILIIKAFRTVVNSNEISEENRVKIESAYNKFLARYQDISDDKSAVNGNDLALEVCSKRLDSLIADMKQFII